MEDFGWSRIAGKGIAAQNAWFIKMYNMLFKGIIHERPAIDMVGIVAAIVPAVRQIANSGSRPITHDVMIDTLPTPSKYGGTSTELFMFARHLAFWLKTRNADHLEHIYAAAELLIENAKPRTMIRLLSFQEKQESKTNVMDFFRKE